MPPVFSSTLLAGLAGLGFVGAMSILSPAESDHYTGVETPAYGYTETVTTQGGDETDLSDFTTLQECRQALDRDRLRGFEKGSSYRCVPRTYP